MSLQPPALLDRAFIADLLAALAHPPGVQLSVVEVRYTTQQPGSANDEHSREEMLVRRSEEGEDSKQRVWEEAAHAAEAASNSGTGIIRASGRGSGGNGVDTWSQWRPLVVIVFDLWVLVDVTPYRDTNRAPYPHTDRPLVLSDSAASCLSPT